MIYGHSFQAFGGKLVKLELTNCTHFQSGTALNIRKYCHNLQYLKLEIDSTDANSNAGIQEALQEQNIQTLENQVETFNWLWSVNSLDDSTGFKSARKTVTAPEHNVDSDGQIWQPQETGGAPP